MKQFRPWLTLALGALIGYTLAVVIYMPFPFDVEMNLKSRSADQLANAIASDAIDIRVSATDCEISGQQGRQRIVHCETEHLDEVYWGEYIYNGREAAGFNDWQNAG